MEAACKVFFLSGLFHVACCSNKDGSSLVGISEHLDALHTFDGYISLHGRSYAKGSEEYNIRRQLFEDRVNGFRQHNALQRSWMEGVNQFTDRTDEELKQYRGFKRSQRINKAQASPMATSVLEDESLGSLSGSPSSNSVATLRSHPSSVGQVLVCICGVVCLLKLCMGSGSSEKSRPQWQSFALVGLVLVCVAVGCLWLPFKVVAPVVPALGEAPKVESCIVGSPCSPGFTCNAYGFCEESVKQLPESIDWSERLPSGKINKDQGSCGSCWALATAGTLQLYGEILTNQTFDVSAQGMLGCAPNPHECGGQGGCQGSTPELALAWASKYGVYSTKFQKYTATSNCPKTSFRVPPALTVKNYMLLETNKGSQVLHALVSVGPLIASIAADKIFGYQSGVFAGCSNVNPVVDHSVIVMGYGVDGLKYWRIRNSWGNGWGENGFFRLKRHVSASDSAGDGDEEPCAWDEDPSKGFSCKDPVTRKYPKRLWVCGECGILSDTLYPVGVALGQA